MNDSWYRASVPAVSPRAQLQGGLEADVCIVGAGFTGLWTAYYLSQLAPEKAIVVIEAKTAMCQAEHSVLMCRLSGQQACTTGGAGWVHAKGLAE